MNEINPKLNIFAELAKKHLREYFKLPENYKLDGNTQLDELTEESHGLIRFTFDLEDRFGFELSDMETAIICINGTVQKLIEILKNNIKQPKENKP